MKIEIEEDWISDVVHLTVDGKRIGSIYVQPVDLVAEIVEELAKLISPNSEIIRHK